MDSGVEPVVPVRLGARLREMESVGGVGAGLDEAVGGMAAREFARRGRQRFLLRTASGLAAAAGLALAVWVAWPGSKGGGVGNGVVVAGLDPRKRVDILDAFKLARLLRDGNGGAGVAAIPKSWDVTGDGAVDQADVDRLGAMAVRLGGEGGAS